MNSILHKEKTYSSLFACHYLRIELTYHKELQPKNSHQLI